MQQADCVRNIWIVGAIAGLVVMLFASVLGHTPWPGGLFLGIMTCVLGGGLLIWLLMTGRQAAFDPRLPKPANVPDAGIKAKNQPGQAVTHG